MTEVLTLIQTNKSNLFQLFYTIQILERFFGMLQNPITTNGYLDQEDINLLRVSDEPKEVVEIIKCWYLRQAILEGRR
jgi:predicted Rossmann-fold nucleotide-binding protein